MHGTRRQEHGETNGVWRLAKMHMLRRFVLILDSGSAGQLGKRAKRRLWRQIGPTISIAAVKGDFVGTWSLTQPVRQ